MGFFLGRANQILGLLLIVLLAGPPLRGAALLNRGYVDLLRSGWESGGAAPITVRYLQEAAAAGELSAGWGLGLLAHWQGDDVRSRELWASYLEETPARVDILYNLHRNDEGLARAAHERYPTLVLAFYWLAEILRTKDLPATIALYEEALALSPSDAVRWVELGEHYRNNRQVDDALRAYDWGCRLRDVGGNGCWHAGLLAEELGQNAEAIRYYRLTLRQIPNYGPALERLAALGG